MITKQNTNQNRIGSHKEPMRFFAFKDQYDDNSH